MSFPPPEVQPGVPVVEPPNVVQGVPVNKTDVVHRSDDASDEGDDLTFEDFFIKGSLSVARS